LSRIKPLIIGGAFFSILLYLLLRVFLSSPRLSEDKLAELYIQLSVAEEMFAGDTLKLEEEKKRIFEQAGVTQGEMDDFIKRLNQTPEKWVEVWKKITEKLEGGRENLKSP